jgi:DNA polymerase III delta prime subunit
MITKEQVKQAIDKLEDKQTLELVYQLIQRLKNTPNQSLDQEKAMADFFGIHKKLGIESVEEELRLIRKGRWRNQSDI